MTATERLAELQRRAEQAKTRDEAKRILVLAQLENLKLAEELA